MLVSALALYMQMSTFRHLFGDQQQQQRQRSKIQHLLSTFHIVTCFCRLPRVSLVVQPWSYQHHPSSSAAAARNSCAKPKVSSQIHCGCSSLESRWKSLKIIHVQRKKRAKSTTWKISSFSLCFPSRCSSRLHSSSSSSLSSPAKQLTRRKCFDSSYIES